jgi:hypothetical protein
LNECSCDLLIALDCHRLSPADFLPALHLRHHALLGFEAAAGAHCLKYFAHLGVAAVEIEKPVVSQPYPP